MNNVLGPLAAFAAVLVLIPVALWLLKRTPLGASAAGAGHLRVVAALPLAPNQRLLTVEVGQGDERRWLVIGVTPGGMRTLHTMAPQADAPAAEPATGPSFAQSFAQVLGRPPRPPEDPHGR
ncbi:flagellar biosynthetic protein FliO [Ideonella sp. A 288]|uniref:flagellar biosynthetic protein FliO n=1 Tax=Ideonella sp. A 288 TaxID=1962181 RepID=UPI000B4B9034|nr:flagellar biosynthetic protein FliO [Ideonella sp. A 288]